MLFSDKKRVERIAPQLKLALIVDPNAASARLIADILRETFKTEVHTAASNERALRMCEGYSPSIVFVEYQSGDVDGVAFTRALRRSTHASRRAPVVMVTAEATQAALLAARDAGVHEFLCKPFSFHQLMRRLEAVTLHQRDWVEAMSYIGPDRRRFNSGDYVGPRKRRADNAALTDQQRIEQALKILRSAVAGVAADPEQAVRAMAAQTDVLRSVATQLGDAGLAHAAKAFQGQLDQLDPWTLDQRKLESLATPLLRYLPPEEGLLEVSAA